MFNISRKGFNIFGREKASSSDTWTLLMELNFIKVNDFVLNNPPTGNTISIPPNITGSGYYEKILVRIKRPYDRPDPAKGIFITSIDSPLSTAIPQLYDFGNATDFSKTLSVVDDNTLYTFEVGGPGIKVTGANSLSDPITFTSQAATFPGDWTDGAVSIYGVIKQFPV